MSVRRMPAGHFGIAFVFGGVYDGNPAADPAS